MTTDHPVATVLLHPSPTADVPGRPQLAGDPDATRLLRIASPHPGEWPWRRLTGLGGEVPSQGADLSAWRVQPLWEIAIVLGHPR